MILSCRFAPCDCDSAGDFGSNLACAVWHMDCCSRVYKLGFADSQLDMSDGEQSTCASVQDDDISTNFVLLQGYMRRCKKLAAKETCVKSQILGTCLFRCIFSENLTLVSSCKEFAHWAEFQMDSENETHNRLSLYMQSKTPQSLWHETVAALYQSMLAKIIYMQQKPEFGIDHVIQSKIQQYKLIWDMPHVVRKTK